ncbi:hypothetical protein HOLleu_41189 [Holothuria leucospilota]|uniref:Uncharacterized protein n=1 Tax=Holothuria leucospilota TaxID=206669 RepID=A0A9Q1BBX9_HOLLE|nr:hypothetical protein HOLleu_41189 [Holothuria leucospilota]
MVFEIVDFHPSISQQLLVLALAWAKTCVPISELDFSAIMHVRKSVLFSNDTPWTKRTNANSFDVTMGSYDGVRYVNWVAFTS